MTITAEQRKQFEEDGFFIWENAFSPEEIDSLTSRIDVFVNQHYEQLAKKGNEWISRANEIAFTAHLAASDPEIMKFVSQDKLVDLSAELIDPTVSLYWDQSVYKKPETKRDFPWHQDNGYTAVLPEEYLTCWIALDDVTIENGCIWVLSGSHKQGLVEHVPTSSGYQCYTGEDPGIPVPIRKGSMVVFSSLLFHRSGPNLSDTSRKAYIVQYISVDATLKETGEPLNRHVIRGKSGQ